MATDRQAQGLLCGISPDGKRKNVKIFNAEEEQLFQRAVSDGGPLEYRVVPPSRTKPTLRGKKSAFPGFIAPARATLRAAPPTGAGWVHELKFDGYRLQAHIRRGGVKLLTRSGLDWTAKFGALLAAAFADLPVDEAIVDGERQRRA